MSESLRGRARPHSARAIGGRAALIVLAIACGAACAPRQRAGSAPEASFETTRSADTASLRGGAIVVALAEGVDPAHAPTPTNDSERLVFRNFYETFVRVDAEGALHAGLASRWERSNDGLEWTFTLREGARFWDGTPLEPVDVRLAWMATERRDRAAGRDRPWSSLEGGAEAVAARDDGRLTVRLAAPGDTPAFFAHPALAVADRRRGEAWPVGTGAFRAPSGPGRAGPDLVCLPNEQRMRDGSPWVRLVFRARPGADPRDFPADGVDTFLARNRAALSYYATVPGWVATALPADRFYALFVPDAMPPGTAVLWRGAVSDEARTELASHVVLSDAAPATGASGGGAPSDPPGAQAKCAARVTYRADDDDARRIAERLAFLGSRRCAEPTDSRAIPLPPAGFERAILLREEGPFVAALDASDPDDAARLAERGDVIPLVTTRANLVMRAGLAGVEIDGDGAVRFDRAGWAAEASAP